MARPTNSWFANLLYGTGREMVAPLPYHCKVTDTGLDVCIPALDSTAFSTAIIAVWAANLSLGSTAAASSTQKVTGFSDLGVTMTWSSGMTSDLVRGAAYVTMRYAALTPRISTIHAVTAVNGATVGATGTFTGSTFKLALNNGQTWKLYFSSSVTLTLAGSQTLTAGAAFTGTVRAAILPATAGAEAALDASAACIPTGGTVAMSLTGPTYAKTLTYTTTGTGQLLTYAMPHHQDVLVSPTYAAATVGSLRGSLRGVLGSTWTLTMPAAVVGETNKNPIDPAKLSAVTAALAVDKAYNPPVPDPYFGGKYVAKLGRLASIAQQVGDTSARDQLLATLKARMVDYFALLRYETNKGGIVSLVGLSNGDADFGNGYFNDHHFHYGYAVYASSVIARYDSAWATANRDKVNALVRDIANPSSSDAYFTPLRHWDHYEGHSWASGYPAATDGRNQESTSEAVAAWWGVQQWGVTSAQPAVAQLGTMLMTEEILTARRYWQVRQADTTVYPTSGFKSKGVVGILWSGKVDYGTWFSSAPECIFGIQMLPTTPTTEALIDPAWLAEVWTNNLASIYAAAQEGWKGPLVGAWAQVNPADAWTKVQALTAYDDGTSRTQMLYHVATQVAPTVGYPDATNTGVPAGTTLAAYTGPTSINTAGTIIDGKTITGQLTINADNVVVKNCDLTATSTYAILAWGKNFTLQDSAVHGNAGQVAIAGFSDQGAGDIHLLRVHVQGSPDQVRMGGNGSTVVDSYFHNVYGPAQGNAGAHNDTVGVLPGVTGTLIDHCTIFNEEGQTSAVELGDIRSAQTTGTLRNSLIAGGGYTIYAMGASGGLGWSVTGNKFSTRFFANSGAFGPVTSWAAGTGNTWTGNTWADGPNAGQPVNP